MKCVRDIRMLSVRYYESVVREHNARLAGKNIAGLTSQSAVIRPFSRPVYQEFTRNNK